MTGKHIVPTLLVLLLLLAGCSSAPPETLSAPESPDQLQSEIENAEAPESADHTEVEEDTSVRREVSLPGQPYSLLQVDDDLYVPSNPRWYILYRQMNELVKVVTEHSATETPKTKSAYVLCLENENALLFMNNIYSWVELDGDGVLHPIDFFPEIPVVEGSEEAKIREITYDERYFYQTPGTIYLFYGTSYGGGHAMYSCFYGVDLETLEAFRFQYVEGQIFDMQLIDDRFYMLLSYAGLSQYNVYVISVEDLSILEHYSGRAGDPDGYGGLSIQDLMFGENGEIYFRYKYSGLGPMLVRRVA